MRKKILLGLMCMMMLVLTACGNNSSKIVSTLTLDINPSIEINLNKKQEIVSTKALNKDAEEIISDDLNGKSLNDALGAITEKVIEKGYAPDGKVTILVTSNGEVSNNDVKDTIEKKFNEKQVSSDVVVIEKITEEDEKFAKEHGISAAKAAYIIEITRENQNVTMESLISKSVSEIKETKETGYYCDEGYTLNGDTCIKKIGEEKAIDASVCPKNSVEIDGKCYKTVAANEESYCKNGLTLKNGKCVGTELVDAKATCAKGTYNSKTRQCEVLTYAGEAIKKCPHSEQKLLSNGRCASPHMGAHFDDPEGVIDPATECCCGDTWYPDSSAKDGKCYKAEASQATYSCTTGKLQSSQCLIESSKTPDTRLVCNNGAVLYQDRVCVDKNSTVEKTQGYKCQTTPSTLKGNTCILYEVVDAKR